MSAAFLDSRRRIPETPSFRNSSHVPAITQHAERIIPHMVPRAHLSQISGLRTLPSSSLPTYPLMTQALESLAVTARELCSL